MIIKINNFEDISRGSAILKNRGASSSETGSHEKTNLKRKRSSGRAIMTS